jgi:hypothetical protein
VGHQEKVKALRRQTRKAWGEDAAFFGFETYHVMFVRGFWGRMKWLLLGR